MSRNPAPPVVPNATRQALASIVLENTTLRGRIQVVEDDNRNLRGVVMELQDREEELRTDVQEQKLTLAVLEARLNKLEKFSETTGGVGGKRMKSKATKAGDKNEDKKIKQIAKATLVKLFGVAKIKPGIHCAFPKVSKNHMEWPSRMDNGHRVPSVRFDFTKPYDATCNADDYNTWVDLTVAHGPVIAGLSDIAAPIDRQRVLSACQNVYGYWKRQFNARTQTQSAWDELDGKIESTSEEGDEGDKMDEDRSSKGKERAEEDKDAPMVQPDPNADDPFDPNNPFNLDPVTASALIDATCALADARTDPSIAGPSEHNIFMFSDPTAMSAIFPDATHAAQPSSSSTTATTVPKRLEKERVKEKNRRKGKGKLLGEMTSALQGKGNSLARRTSSAKRRAQAAEDKIEKGKIAQRKKGKLTTRRRRRDKLTGPDAKYKDAKYDDYFVEGAMSDDQTVRKPADEEGKQRPEPWYLTRAPTYFSDEIIAIRAALDRVTDPLDTSHERRRGDPLEGVPPKRRTVHTSIREWMVKPELLQQNPEWLTEGRVYANGPGWGNAGPALGEQPQMSNLQKGQDEDEDEVLRAQKALDAHRSNQNRDDELGEL